jgi:hypothetical protein
LQLAVGHRLEGPLPRLTHTPLYRPRVGAQLRDGDGRLDDVTVGFGVIANTVARDR